MDPMIEDYDDSPERAARIFARERSAGFGSLPRLKELPLDPTYEPCPTCGKEECYCPEPSIYKDKWEQIEDEHYEQCPMGIAAVEKRISTLCLCKNIEAASKSLEKESN